MKEWPLGNLYRDMLLVHNGNASWQLGVTLHAVGLTDALYEDEPEQWGEPVWSLNDAGIELLRMLRERFYYFTNESDD